MEDVHPLLLRQWQRLGPGGSFGLLPDSCQAFLEAVDESYRQGDREREMLQRSLELSSQELLAANDQMSALFQAFPDVLMLITPKGIVEDVRGHVQRLLGVSEAQIVGRHLTECALASYCPEIVGRVGAEGLGPLYNEQLVLPASGQNAPAFWEIRMVPLPGRGTVLIIRDITRQGQAERALAEERDRLRVTLESITDGVLATDGSGVIRWGNRQAAGILEREECDLAGLGLRELVVLDQGDDAVWAEQMPAILGGAVVDFSRWEPVMDCPGGRKVLLLQGARMPGVDGEEPGMVFVLRNITQKRRMEEALNNIHHLEAIGVLAGGIAHDFNNFLAGILGNVSLARIRAHRGEDTEKELQAAEDAAKRARELSRQFIAFARGGAPVKEFTALPDLIRESADFLLRGSSVKAEIQFPKDFWTVSIDRGQMHQVVNNLVLNALQAMPSGGQLHIRGENRLVRGEADEAGLQPGPYVRVVFRDEGEGIPREWLGRVFDPYFSTKKQGTGLGLTSSLSIVHRHQGYLNVESRPGEGARFILMLPASPQALPAVPSPRREAPEGEGLVLLMDDDPLVLETVEAQLRYLGYGVISGQNSRDILDLVRMGQEVGIHFDLVMLDLKMGGDQPGEETARQILELEPDCRMLVSSAYSDSPVFADYRGYGFQGRLLKPYSLAELGEALACLLDPERG